MVVYRLGSSSSGVVQWRLNGSVKTEEVTPTGERVTPSVVGSRGVGVLPRHSPEELGGRDPGTFTSQGTPSLQTPVTEQNTSPEGSPEGDCRTRRDQGSGTTTCLGPTSSTSGSTWSIGSTGVRTTTGHQRGRHKTNRVGLNIYLTLRIGLGTTF